MNIHELHETANEPPRPLWRQNSWEVSPEQLGNRELEIRAKAQELADRNNELEGAIAYVWDGLGIVKPHGSGADVEYPTAELVLPPDTERGIEYSAILGRSPSGSAWVKYYSKYENGERRELPRASANHTSIFDVDDTTSLELRLQYGTFTWVNDCLDYDNSRPHILQVAEMLIGAWEGSVPMLRNAAWNSELNPDIAAVMAAKETPHSAGW